MSDTRKVQAANGQTYTFHNTTGLDGYVYALGHRVYGSVRANLDGSLAFTAKGKYAFIVAAPAVEHEALDASV